VECPARPAPVDSLAQAPRVVKAGTAASRVGAAPLLVKRLGPLAAEAWAEARAAQGAPRGRLSK